jgi:hypothetical protein
MRDLRLEILMVACLLGAGCGPAPAPLNIIDSTGTNTEIDPGQDTPDDTLRQLAGAGINAAVLLGPLVKDLGGLAAAFYDARDQHPAAYRLQEIAGWEFRNGWYNQRDEAGERVLRAQFVDGGGTPPAWDVTRKENYDPELHPGFPGELSQIRFEVDRTLPGGGRMALTVFAELKADRRAVLSAAGSGSLSVPAPLGTASFEALNATFTAGGEVERGLIGLKSPVTGIGTLQFTGEFQRGGLSVGAKLMKNGKAAGEVQLADGRWQIKNSKGSFPLQ